MYKIYGIKQGEREVDYSGSLPGVVAPGTMGHIAYYMWCIKGEGKTVLVDTGMDDEEAGKRNFIGLKYLEDKLKKLDVDPANIDTVIVSHLHADHFSAYELYPNATFLVQKRDIEHLTGPGVKFHQIIEFAANMQEVVRLAYAKRIRYLDGDEQIAPGIQAVLVGGHSPGIQVVVVTTSRGKAVICSDAVELYQNLEKDVAGHVVDLLQMLLSYDRIRALASSPELIIPGHDPLVMKNFPNPIENVVEIG